MAAGDLGRGASCSPKQLFTVRVMRYMQSGMHKNPIYNIAGKFGLTDEYAHHQINNVYVCVLGACVLEQTAKQIKIRQCFLAESTKININFLCV